MRGSDNHYQRSPFSSIFHSPRLLAHLKLGTAMGLLLASEMGGFETFTCRRLALQLSFPAALMIDLFRVSDLVRQILKISHLRKYMTFIEIHPVP